MLGILARYPLQYSKLIDTSAVPYRFQVSIFGFHSADSYRHKYVDTQNTTKRSIISTFDPQPPI